MPKKKSTSRALGKCNYFVDEAGDGTLFDSEGRVIIGTAGCSRFFILGLLEIPDPITFSDNLNSLREQLLADPYFKDVPSVQPVAKKTALAFHAKDDLPEIRREVLSFLRSQEGLRFYAVLHDKRKVLEYVRQRNIREPSYRYNANELYDFLVRRLFGGRLHKYDTYDIFFAKRGKSDRTAALRTALEAARTRFQNKWHIESHAPISIITTIPPQNPGLQAADYFNWSLQRLYETGEDRFLTYLWPNFRLVIDIDDTRKARYGRYYTKEKPLNRAALEERL
jgi:hypothetical protein